MTLNDVGLACDDLLRSAAHPGLSVDDRRRDHRRNDPRGAQARTAAHDDRVRRRRAWRSTCGRSAESLRAVRPILTGARELDRPDLEIRVLEAWGSDAPLKAIEELASRLDEDGDRFALDMVRRRLTGETATTTTSANAAWSSSALRPTRGRPAALAELGVVDPPTDAPVEQRAARTRRPGVPARRRPGDDHATRLNGSAASAS